MKINIMECPHCGSDTIIKSYSAQEDPHEGYYEPASVEIHCKKENRQLDIADWYDKDYELPPTVQTLHWDVDVDEGGPFITNGHGN